MVSINDVADRANVSISTVSRVINQNANVSREKEKAVLKAVDELDYIPNGLAQGLVTKKSKSIGVLIADIGNLYYSYLVKSIEKELRAAGYYAVIGNTEWDGKREKEYIRHLIQRQVDGFILASTSLSSEYIEQLAEKEIPLVVLDREINSDKIDKIRINDYKGGYQAAEHLIESGYQYFIHLKGAGFTATAADRSRGFKDCMQKYSVDKENYKLLSSSFVEEEAAQDMSDFLEGNNFKSKRLGIFAANDAAAFGVLKELKRRGINVPREAGVIGFDNVNFAEYSSPALTTIGRPIADIGKISAQILLKRLNKSEDEKIKHKNMTLDVQLIKRESTAKIK
ncbi:LacI family transcriptional regulator [Halanaerobium saccharolyticum]|uniref:LacI family transcriptional regulator n=1 Tax=Halanaerobium saccharolyticum TaxID=43595 RepID=A0A4R7YS65_9FIRM|nr:LacI family DNA-binding transcriptional regulator [Halanaerobium saccharolyticum]RAK05460.1 LacI family transcriptional regulator [Halanaerobium saccharolyticum]TDV99795.1 LacI family transcriptional regulator [Halanaerobium saccharolyticum]TDX52017.1 LacI family transcriptional regulator [Halanaerobium saccharolyticum]